jgi:hypothetical protein
MHCGRAEYLTEASRGSITEEMGKQKAAGSVLWMRLEVSTIRVSGWIKRVNTEAISPPSIKLRQRPSLSIDDVINRQREAAFTPQVSLTASIRPRTVRSLPASLLPHLSG